jgi:hypothetical protein
MPSLLTDYSTHLSDVKLIISGMFNQADQPIQESDPAPAKLLWTISNVKCRRTVLHLSSSKVGVPLYIGLRLRAQFPGSCGLASVVSMSVVVSGIQGSTPGSSISTLW